MSGLITNPTSQFINPFLGNICENAKIFIGKVNTDGLNLDNRQDVYLMQWSDEATVSKVPLPQPLVTNSAGVIVYQGLPVTPWVDGAYSITIISYDGALLYQSFYVDDPTYWLRLDLATEPARTDDGLHYAPDDEHGINMIGGGAPILSPNFEGEPRAPTPPTGDSSTRIATTEFVTASVSAVAGSGVVGTFDFWLGSTPPVNAVVADGAALSKESYPELYAILGDTVATANGLVPDSASFFVPDVRARFVRGVDNGAQRSTSAERVKYYDSDNKAHSHGVTLPQSRVSSADSDVTLVGPQGTTGDAGEAAITVETSGGAEAMPMCTAMLPIIWVSDGTVSDSVSVWWTQPQYLSSRPAVHHYHEETGELLGSSPANPSPLEPGKWLTPAHATHQNPLSVIPGHVMRFVDEQWIHDAQLFAERLAGQQKAKRDEKQQREAANIRLKKKALMDKWLQENGAPYSIDEFLQELK